MDSLNEVVKELGIEIAVGVETWEIQKYPLEDLLIGTGLKVISRCTQKVKKNQPGGGCCILINSNRFFITEPKIQVPVRVEEVWCVISPTKSPKNTTIKIFV